ncbi:MAG: metalloregulator ArsR/SmtB family transcription factor [Pirellulales bacterium]
MNPAADGTMATLPAPPAPLPAGVVGLEDSVARELVQVFKLFSDETRLKILAYLFQARELHVRALCEMLGQSQPAVSHHLGLLRAAGLVDARRSGKHNYYHLQPRRLEELFSRAIWPADASGRRLRFDDYLRGISPPH